MAKNIRIIPESGSIILMQNGATEAQSVHLEISGNDPSGSVSVTNNTGTEIFKINNQILEIFPFTINIIWRNIKKLKFYL